MDHASLGATFQVAGRAAIESHNASSPLQQREQRARETARRSSKYFDTACDNRVTKHFSPCEEMTLQRAARSRTGTGDASTWQGEKSKPMCSRLRLRLRLLQGSCVVIVMRLALHKLVTTFSALV
jgi:hypothetical protein